MKEQIVQYMKKYSRDIWNDINIRFELGEPYENGTDERIIQVNKRVNDIFENLFMKDEYIYIYIVDRDVETDIMFGNLTPNYLYEVLHNYEFDEDKRIEYDEDTDEEGNIITLTTELKVRICYDCVKNLPYKEILEGIANHEQGRSPSIIQEVYFISVDRDIVFYMYDDRGCIAYSDSKNTLEELYFKYNDWIVDYWREYFDGIFKHS